MSTNLIISVYYTDYFMSVMELHHVRIMSESFVTTINSCAFFFVLYFLCLLKWCFQPFKQEFSTFHGFTHLLPLILSLAWFHTPAHAALSQHHEDTHLLGHPGEIGTLPAFASSEDEGSCTLGPERWMAHATVGFTSVCVRVDLNHM